MKAWRHSTWHSIVAKAPLLGSAMLAALLVGACGKASPPAPVAPSPTGSVQPSQASWRHQPPGKLAGEQAASQLVAAAVLPPAARRLTNSPSPILGRPFTTVGDDNFIDRHAWWKTSLSADALLTYLSTHPPAGLVSSGSGGSETGPNQPTTRSLTFGPATPLAGNPALQLTVVAAGDGTSWLRVDGQTIWYPPRSAAENAPTTGVVTISLSGGPTRRLTDAPTVHRLATEFNQLLRTTPGKSAGLACSADQRTISIAFTATGAAHPTLVASRTGCSTGWNVRGPHGDLPALENGTDLLTDALRLLGIPPTTLWSPPLPAHS